MRFYPAIVVMACAIVAGCTAPPVAPQPAGQMPGSPAINTALTCDELNASGKDAVGHDILWLEGNYSGRTRTSSVPVGWIKTVAQSVGGNCVIPPNVHRTVIDVIAQVHRDYFSAARSAARQPAASEDTSTAVSTAATCGQLGSLFTSGDKRGGGFTILWLEGYYSGRAGISSIPADWIKTVAQGIGAGCSVDANSYRPVIDIIAEAHRNYGGAAGVR